MDGFTNGSLVVELLDKAGERKYAKTKHNEQATAFLADKNSYILGYIVPPQNRKRSC